MGYLSLLRPHAGKLAGVSEGGGEASSQSTTDGDFQQRVCLFEIRSEALQRSCELQVVFVLKKFEVLEVV